MQTITGSNVTIMVKDMDKAISFYEQIGFILKQRWDNHYAMMSAEGITIGIHPTHSADTSSGTVSIGLMINDINEAKALLDTNGIAYKEENDGKSGLYLHFRDPDNTVVYYVKPMW